MKDTTLQPTHTRPVDKVTIHGRPMAFEDLIEKAVPADARYIVLDLDKTCFLGLNMGEMLGWELIARDAYGDARLDELQGERRASRYLWDWRRPGDVARYVARGAGAWGWPGLCYLFGLKLPMKQVRSARWVYRRFGPEPVRAVQHIPQMNLLHQLSEVPLERLVELSGRLLERYADLAVVEAQDIERLRRRAPGAKIILSSGSPRPVVEAAAVRLGVDDFFYTRIEVHEGYLSAPPVFRALSADAALPRRIAPRESIQINTGPGKIEQLLARYPDLFEPGVVNVGITDTDHGEDHCWAEHFGCVVDVNSTAPFAPFVGVGSPLREIHSASVLTRDGQFGRSGEPSRVLTRGDLSAMGKLHARIDGLTAKLHEIEAAPSSSRLELEEALVGAGVEVDEAIEAYNAGPRRARKHRLAALKQALETQQHIERSMIHHQAEAAAISCEIHHLKALARTRAGSQGSGLGARALFPASVPLRLRTMKAEGKASKDTGLANPIPET